jgi:hypothetical protein
MKMATLLCSLIAVSWGIFTLTQLWLAVVSAEVFCKLTISAVILFALVAGVSLAWREYAEDRRQKRDGFLDE